MSNPQVSTSQAQYSAHLPSASSASTTTAPPEPASASGRVSRDSRVLYIPSSNAAPGRLMPMIVSASAAQKMGEVVQPTEDEPLPTRAVALARWGLVRASTPATAEPDFWAMSNARSDNLHRVHHKLVASQRCVVPLKGFYEWNKVLVYGKEAKKPYYIRRADGQDMAIAGVYDTWRRSVTTPTGEIEHTNVHTFALVTVDASETFSWLHTRMPAILESDAEIDAWLDAAHVPFSHVSHLLRPKNEGLEWWPVTDKIGKVGFQDGEAWRPVQDKAVGALKAMFAKKAASEVKKEEEEEEQDRLPDENPAEEPDPVDHASSASSPSKSFTASSTTSSGSRLPSLSAATQSSMTTTSSPSPSRKRKLASDPKPGDPTILSMFVKKAKPSAPPEDLVVLSDGES